MTHTLEPIASAITAPLVELFSAIQGEGLNVGTRQIFIRLGGCDLRCRFCDSAHTWHASATCRIERHPGQRDFFTHANPISVDQLLNWVRPHQQAGLHDSISITGGEPLLHASFLQALLPALRAATGLPLYLETGGHRPQDLHLVLPYLDMVGMDIKLPSVSGETHWQAHQEFLNVCHRAQVTVFCKVIVDRVTQSAELEQVAALVADVDPNLPIFLQPVTPLTGDGPIQPPSPAQVLAWQAGLKRTLRSVRVVPQTHKMLDQL